MALELVNKTPFTSQLLPLTAENGAAILRVVLKGGFDIDSNGTVQPSPVQPEIVMEDKYWGEPGASAIRYESEVILGKPRTDLVINGQAHAPNGRPVSRMEVAASYQGRIIKRLNVTGDRQWRRGILGWQLTEPEPFVSLPITYDRAYGGSDAKGSEPRNRSGRGYRSSHGNDFNGCPAPNVEFPDQLVRSPSDKPAPAGFGVIGKHWMPRLGYAGTYDDAWLAETFPLLPHDFDRRFFQSVTEDQWIARPSGGEEVAVAGMTSDGPLRFRLPECRVHLGLRYRDTFESRTMDVETVLVEPDARRLTIVWGAVADIHGDPFRLLRIVLGDASGKQPSAVASPCTADGWER